MKVEAFGRTLIETGDLDPIYVMLVGAGLDEKLLKRWLLAYWCFYHAGVASCIAENGRDYWADMNAVAYNHDLRFPRGSERRHFRGALAISSVAFLEQEFLQPEDAFARLHGTFKRVTAEVTRWRGFGPWIAFKAADMIDRVLGETIDFSDCELAFYRDPVKGAHKALDQWGITPGTFSDKEAVRHAVDRLIQSFDDYLAPPFFDRAINVQEVETILCKWKSHLNGHYPLGKDTREIRHGLDGWGDLAKSLKEHLPNDPA